MKLGNIRLEVREEPPSHWLAECPAARRNKELLSLCLKLSKFSPKNMTNGLAEQKTNTSICLAVNKLHCLEKTSTHAPR